MQIIERLLSARYPKNTPLHKTQAALKAAYLKHKLSQDEHTFTKKLLLIIHADAKYIDGINPGVLSTVLSLKSDALLQSHEILSSTHLAHTRLLQTVMLHCSAVK